LETKRKSAGQSEKIKEAMLAAEVAE
jgi:hypothetical protein